jgi:hemophore-related protein
VKTADNRRIARIATGTVIGGLALAVLAAPAASATTDCSPAAVDGTVERVTQQAQDYMNAHPEGNKVLMTAALQPRAEAAATIQAYAAQNPQQYADFKQILSQLGTLEQQCGVSVIPAQYKWAYDQFVG